MSYTSDLRAKNILTDIDINVKSILKSNDIHIPLEFRVFDESDEDAILWQDGGLCFTDPFTGEDLGSNDGGWFLYNEPLLIVEGTFGTERGQFGDGQLNRISHSLGPALNGYYGVTMVPYKGQSFIKEKHMKGIMSSNICYSVAKLHNDMALISLKVSANHTGKYLIVDPYEQDVLEELLLQLILERLGMDNHLSEITERILEKTKTHLGSYVHGAKSKQRLERVYLTDGTMIDDAVRYYTHNLESLTTSTKRDGHGLLGKNLIEMNLAREKSTAIFIRMDNNDFQELLQRRSKEFHYIYNSPRINVYNFDNLVFDSPELREKVIEIRHQNLHTDTEKSLMGDIQTAFNEGRIKIQV